MSHLFLRDARFWAFLFSIDQDIARTARESNCPSCGDVLHSARYPRKPRGVSDELLVGYGSRLSYCCAREGCRRRLTPPSVRYLGAKIYLGVVVILVGAMRQGPTPRSRAVLRRHFGADPRTIARWQGFWKETFPLSAFWRVARGRIDRNHADDDLPRSLLERFRRRAATFRDALVLLLRFLSPITVRRGLEFQDP